MENAMQYKRVSVEEAIDWIKQGWELFKKEPGLLIVMTLIYFGISIAGSLVPLVGPIAVTLLSPALGAGFMYVARELEQDRPIEVGDLFQAFKQEGKINQFLILGAISLGISIIGYLVMFGSMIGGMVSVSATGGDPGPLFFIGITIAVLIFITMLFVMVMLLLYSVPLVMLDNVSAIDAIKSSFLACLKNIWPLTVLSAILLIPIVIAIIPFGLGMLVLAPILSMMVYASYKNIYH
ncbi:MAG TPA: DUF975 family protein [Acidiferrobacteraceae bacterium]|nr:DUF975 family protein [Acidiferrobacteraceae bacterium]HEX19859.1 DUF975 family protein [Acidiferrobacteraceae bacterium]